MEKIDKHNKTVKQEGNFMPYLANLGDIKLVVSKFELEEKKSCCDTSTSSQVSNCDGVVLEIYLYHKFQ